MTIPPAASTAAKRKSRTPVEIEFIAQPDGIYYVCATIGGGVDAVHAQLSYAIGDVCLQLLERGAASSPWVAMRRECEDDGLIVWPRLVPECHGRSLLETALGHVRATRGQLVRGGLYLPRDFAAREEEFPYLDCLRPNIEVWCRAHLPAGSWRLGWRSFRDSLADKECPYLNVPDADTASRFATRWLTSRASGARTRRAAGCSTG